MHDVCQNNNVPVWCGGMLESGIGRAHNIALSTLQNFRLPGDVSASKRYWKEDIIDPEVEVSAQGTIKISDEPGTGYKIREDLIEKLAVRKETFKPHCSAGVPPARWVGGTPTRKPGATHCRQISDSRFQIEAHWSSEICNLKSQI